MNYPKKDQSDHVREDQASLKVETVSRIAMPGIKTLHTRPLPEIAASLAAVLKSQSSIKEVRYVIGEYIEITVQDPE